MKKTLRLLSAVVMAIVCCVTSIPRIQVKANTAERTIDFSTETDADLFSTTYGGWSVREGVYKANTAWATTYLTEAVSLTSDKVISFDFCLQDDSDPGHQFNVGLINVSEGTFHGGVSAHFYYSSQYTVELVTLNGAFGNTYDGWIADTVADYFDGQPHTMTISITGKTASYKIDGNEVLTSAEVGLNSAYLAFQSTSTAYTIDNLKIQETAKVPEYCEMELDFSKAEDGAAFATTNGGFAASDGLYKANCAWATTYLNCEIPLDEDKEISFDFCLRNNDDSNHQFNLGFVDIDGGVIGSTALVGHFYCHAQYGELLTLNRDFGSPFGAGWIADNTDNFNDGKVHTMHIQVKDGKAAFYIDKKVIFPDVSVEVTRAYFIMQFSSVDSYIDNFKVSDTLSTISAPPVNPPQPGGEEDNLEYKEMEIGFDVSADGDVFAAINGGWSVTNGVYKANNAWASTYLKCLIPLKENKEIRFDFCLRNNGDSNHQFNLGFVDINRGVIGSTALAGHFYCHAQYGELFTLNRDLGNPVGGGWIADNTDNYNDGKVHTMLIQIQDGKARICMDKKVIFQDATLEAGSAYFILQATSVDSYIDNFKVSDTLTDTKDYAIGSSGSTNASDSANNTSNASDMGNAGYKYKEMSLDFASISDGDAFGTNYGGWSVSDGVYKPNVAWATAYLNCRIPLDEEKEITFDFCMKEEGDKAHQFNVGLVNRNGAAYDTVLAGHFYCHAQYGELLTLNRDFGNPIGNGWIADNTDNFNDGAVHAMMIRIKDGKAAIFIDGNEIFKDIALDVTSAYFILQSTSVDSYIDNFKISDTLTYIPDYPTSTPDPVGDETVKNMDKKDSPAVTKGEVAREAAEGNGMPFWAKVLLIAGASAATILLLIGGAVILKKKKQVKKDE